mmetsp:Transcript_1488/g.2942  ORF Transcript_1488/g.2942 Transcript_1488/m.2942 type:complete len:337 (-) Transcript_1488:16-1026(-)
MSENANCNCTYLREFLSYNADPLPLYVLDLHNVVKDFSVDTRLDVDVAGGVTEGHGLGTKLDELVSGVLGDVTASRDSCGHACNRLANASEHVVYEVHAAVASGLGSDEGTTPVDALASENTLKVVAESLVLAEQETDLATTNTNISSGDIAVGSNMALKLGHERLAEAHNFGVGAALGVKVTATLSTTHGESRKGVLEDLLKAKELDDGQVDGGVEAKASLVGTDGGVELDTEATVHLLDTVVVNPGNAELDGALGLADALENGKVLRLLLDDRLQRVKHLTHSLEKLGLVGISGLHGFEYLVKSLSHYYSVTENFRVKKKKKGRFCFWKLRENK